MPENVSKERLNILKQYGAVIILTSGNDGMETAIKTARELALEKGSV